MLLEFSILLSLYMIIGTIIALFSKRFGVKSTSEYFVGNYRLGSFLASMTYAATTYSAFMMVGLVGLTYTTGIGALGFELAYLVATISILTIFSQKIWKLARERKWISPSEMISDLYESKIIGHFIAIVYLLALIPYVSAQIIGIGVIFESIGLNYGFGIIIATFLTLLWTILAGIWSVATTDAYQAILMITAAFLFLGLTIFKIPDFSIINDVGLSSFWSINTFLAYTIPWIFFAITNPQVVQRLYMPANEKVLKNMIRYFSIYGFLYTLIVVIIGMMAKGLTNIGLLPYITNRDAVTPTLLLNFNPLIASFIFISIVAAAISTANSIILSVTSSIIRDFFERRSSKNILTISNIVVIIFSLIAGLIAFLRPGFIVEMSVLSSVILIPLAPVTIIGLITNAKNLKYGALIGLILGIIFALYNALIYGPLRTFLVNIYGIPISLWILFISILPILLNYIKLKYSNYFVSSIKNRK